MKKVSVIILILLLVLCCVTPCAYAQDNGNLYYVMHLDGTCEYTESYTVSDTVFFTLRTLTDNGNPVATDYSGFYFGDIEVNVTLYTSESYTVDYFVTDDTTNRNNQLQLFTQVHEFVTLIDNLANTQIVTSDVHRYNDANFGDTLPIDYHTYTMLQLAQEMYNVTNGAFNPAVYRLVDLWGFSSRIYTNFDYGTPYDRTWQSNDGAKYYPLPQEKYVQAFSNKQFTDFSSQSVTLSESDGSYFVTKNVSPVVVDGVSYQQWIDLGGVAKGYVADVLNSMFEENGIDCYFINVGTSSLAMGKFYGGKDITVGLQNPYTFFTEYGRLALHDVKMSTSGQYIRKYTMPDGTEYSHIIDGVTGKPASTGVKAVTVVMQDDKFNATKGDCLTTALTVMGKDGIIDFFNTYARINNVDVVVVNETSDGDKQLLSNVDKADIVTEDTDFDKFYWAVSNDNGTFVYVENTSSLLWVIVVGVVIIAVAVVAVIVLCRNTNNLQRIAEAKKDKFFKPMDVAVYVLVLLLILVLFGAFFSNDNQQIRVVKVTDLATQQDLFTYNVQQGSYTVNQTDGWTVEVAEQGNDLIVTMSKTFDGEQRFNQLTVTRGSVVKVKMTDSVCGYHQDCVRSFPTVTTGGGAIVCSPNRLKVVTE